MIKSHTHYCQLYSCIVQEACMEIFLLAMASKIVAIRTGTNEALTVDHWTQWNWKLETEK